MRSGRRQNMNSARGAWDFGDLDLERIVPRHRGPSIGIRRPNTTHASAPVDMAAERTFRNLMDGDARGRHSPGGVSSPGASAASPLSATASPARPNGITPISTYAAKLSQWGLDARDANAPAEASEAPLSPLQDFAIARFLHATPAEQSQMAISPDDDLSPVEGADPAHLYRALMRACSNGDAVRIRHVLDTKAEEGTKLDLDQPDADGVTPLILAACYGHTEAVHELLLHGANPDVGDADGWTPLIWAANNRQPAVARVLLSYNASVNPQTSRGRTVRDFIGEDPQLRALIEGAAADEPEPEPDKGHIGDGTFEDGLTTEKIEFSDDEGTVVSALTAMSVGGTAAFDYQKCLPDQMFVFSPSALPHILDVLVGKIKPAKVKRGLAGEKAEESVPVPANVIFLCARYAFYYHGGDLLETLLDATGQHICIALNVGVFA